ADQQGCLILIDLQDDAVKIRLVFQEELIETLQYDLFTRNELLELERPRTHHVFRIAGMRFQILAIVIDMLGQYRRQSRGKRDEQGRVRLAELEDSGMWIRGLDFFDNIEHRLERMVLLVRHDRERNIFRCNRLAIMKQRILAQMDSERFPVI